MNAAQFCVLPTPNSQDSKEDLTNRRSVSPLRRLPARMDTLTEIPGQGKFGVTTVNRGESDGYAWSEVSRSAFASSRMTIPTQRSGHIPSQGSEHRVEHRTATVELRDLLLAVAHAYRATLANDKRRKYDDVSLRVQRPGTWQFRSIGLLDDSPKQHELQDDLESVILVGTYMAMRYLPHSMTDQLENVTKIMFDHANFWETTRPTGGAGKVAYFYRNSILTPGCCAFRFAGDRPLSNWLFHTRRYMVEWLEYINHDQFAEFTLGERPIFEDLKLHSTRALVDLCDELLEDPGWPNEAQAKKLDYLLRSQTLKNSRAREDGSEQESQRGERQAKKRKMNSHILSLGTGP